jgi:DNA-binding transcriptional LysR family regulator
MQASSIEGVAHAKPKKNVLRLLLLPLVILAGMGLSVEAGLLGPLGVQVGHLWATLSIFGVGSAILFLLLLFSGPQKGPALSELPRWQLIGGFLGPIYVVVLTEYEVATTLEPQQIAALWPGSRRLSLKVRTVIDYFVECFGGVPYWDR